MPISNIDMWRLFILSLILAFPNPCFSVEIPFTLDELALPDDLPQVGPFSIEQSLKGRTKFWIAVYTTVHRWQYIVHDSQHPEIVYGLVDVKNIREHPIWSERKKSIELVREKIRARRKVQSILSSIHNKIVEQKLSPQELSKEEAKVFRQFRNIKGDDKFLKASEKDRIRSQPGLKENFIEGIYESGKYMPGMKQTAVGFGVPPEIVYLPFVESGFDREALSKVGASGVWQFIRSTGKFFLRVDEAVDERNDPMKAAEAAALLMRQNFNALEEWPLAITAYNYGRKGMQDAVKALKSTSLAKIIAEWDGNTFGFASQNFYCEFFAALHVAKNASFYFGKVERAEPFLYDNFVMPEFVDFKVLAKHVGIDEHILRDYNPALTDLVIQGERLIPVGYNLRVPVSQQSAFLRRYNTIPSKYKFRKQKQIDSAS